ncbi:unnamed protein product [Heligmosomoides polygyrus]|uniref:HGTP_anticodon domain-containing protein n=1 Tax=Heligmosomoides polygyrus TaxID=6339 RepID=A0A3P7Y240_HELPZ|nr:unnamed protein product [Heligmosomoides polygyrus]
MPTRCAMTVVENRNAKEQAVGEVLCALDDVNDIDHLEKSLDYAQKAYDASGNKMHFIAAVEVPVVESGSRQGEVKAFKSEKEFDVTDAMHFLREQFRCQGQPFPIMPGHPGIPAYVTSRCQCGSTLTIDRLYIMEDHGGT